MELSLFDTHTHYNHASYAPFQDRVLMGIREGGIGDVLVAGYDLISSLAACMMKEQFEGRGDAFPRIHAAVGIHPEYLPKDPEKDLAALRAMIEKYHPAAIGEMGLHFPRGKQLTEDVRARQMELFLRQLSLCEEYDLPAVLHFVGAAAKVYGIIERRPRIRGILHGFTGSAETAVCYGKAGWLIGIGTGILRENVKKLKEVCRRVPAEYLVAETDCPFGGTGIHSVAEGLPDSLQLKAVMEKIAELKEESFEEVQRTLGENARRMLIHGYREE